MPKSSKLLTNRPWWAVGKTQWGGTPFSTLGLAWCCWCKMEVDSDTEAHHEGTTYVYRRNCCRCGHVIACGAVEAPIVAGGRAALPPKALRWVHDVTKDRR